VHRNSASWKDIPIVLLEFFCGTALANIGS
jgi:hypothetical protein